MTIRTFGALSALCILAGALAACQTLSADEDPVQIKLKDLDTRLSRIERVMENQSLLQLSNQLEALRSDVRAMHNDVDQLTNSLDAGRKQQRDYYNDLDQRIRSLESRGSPAAAVAAGGAAVAAAASAASSPKTEVPAAGDDKAEYQAAFNLLKDGQYDHAITAFQKFLATYPDSSLADNAQYWLGEAYYVNKSYSEAQAAFQGVVDKYPQSRKFPDALLKIGYCRYETKQWDAAKAVLTQVVTQYPDSPAGRLAQQRLEKMATEKH